MDNFIKRILVETTSENTSHADILQALKAQMGKEAWKSFRKWIETNPDLEDMRKQLNWK